MISSGAMTDAKHIESTILKTLAVLLVYRVALVLFLAR